MYSRANTMHILLHSNNTPLYQNLHNFGSFPTSKDIAPQVFRTLELQIMDTIFHVPEMLALTLKLPGPYVGMGGSLTVTVA